MTLKAKKKVESSKEVRIKVLRGEIEHHKNQIAELEELIKTARKEILEIEIAPFKIGGYAMYECGAKVKKLQKCLLECSEYGNLQVRPVKEDGTLSGRHYIVYPPMGKTYQDILQEVEE